MWKNWEKGIKEQPTETFSDLSKQKKENRKESAYGKTGEEQTLKASKMQ